MGLAVLFRPYSIGCYLGLGCCLILWYRGVETPKISSEGIQFNQVKVQQQGQDWLMTAERAVQGEQGQMILTGQPKLNFGDLQCESEKIIQSAKQLNLFELQLQDLNIGVGEMELSTFAQPTKIDDLALWLEWPLKEQVDKMYAQKWVGPQSDLYTLMERHQKLFDHRESTTEGEGQLVTTQQPQLTNTNEVSREDVNVQLKAEQTQLLIARLRLRAKMKGFSLLHPHWQLTADQSHWSSPNPSLKLYGHIKLSREGSVQESSSGEIDLRTGQLILYSPERVIELGPSGSPSPSVEADGAKIEDFKP